MSDCFKHGWRHEKDHCPTCLDMQAPSTRAALLQSEADRVMHRLSPLPSEAQRLKEDGSVDLNVRPITAEEEIAYNGMRRRRGSWIETLFSPEHKTIKVEATRDAKDRAVHAYMAGSTLKAIKDRFERLMRSMFEPAHTEVISEQIKKAKHDK